jgi:hypothetical protein
VFLLLARAVAALTFLSVVCPAVPAAAQSTAAPPAVGPTNELDAFMEKVLARREIDRQRLKEYVLDEVEAFEILGPGKAPLHRSRREFTWYVRDGVHVRSPVKFNGVSIDEEQRRDFERRWLEEERQRAERQAKREREKREGKETADDRQIVITSGSIDVSSAGIPTQPRFVSEAYFMDFKFEPGNYYLAAREQLDGKDVLRIEYYPTRMFDDDDPPEKRKRDKGQEYEDKIMRQMNKTAQVTLWVDPAAHQIVKYTFDNIWMDFLPATWLVRVDDIRASMTMGQPFPGVWLPRDMNIHAGVTLANGSFEAGYTRDFSEYRLAETSTKLRVPKIDHEKHDEAAVRIAPYAHLEFIEGSGPFVPEDEGGEPASATPGTDIIQQPEVLVEIRVHGNAFLSDQDVLKFAGVSIGQPLDSVEAVRKRLEDSGRFETIEVRKRYRSLTATNEVALILLVHEKPGLRSAADINLNPVVRPWQRFRSGLMFLPILSYADGYGFTYGARFSTVDFLGAGERLSVPLTWGGTRRAALEFERTFQRGPLTRIESSAAIWNRENPRFEIRDQRVELKARAERLFAGLFRTGIETSRSTIEFGELDDRLWTLGATAALDTRADPAYPANAVYLGTGWTGMHFRSVPERVNRYTADARGYFRLVGQTVVAARAQYVTADRTLPPYERLLLGGSSSVRGFETGAFDGDRTLSGSVELRHPFTSVLSGAKLGFNVFYDAGKAWDVGQRIEGAEWRRGAGAGLFLIASVVRINLDVARGLKTGDTRVHLSSGFTF